MKRLISWLAGMKTLKKMMVVYTVGGLIPLLIVSSVIVISTRQALVDQAVFVAETNNERIIRDISGIVDTARDISDGLYLDKELRKVVNVKYQDAMSVIEAMNNYTRIDEYLQIYEEISTIRVFVANPTLLDNSQINRITPTIANEEWYRQVIEADGKTMMAYRYDDLQRDQVLSMMRVMKNEYGDFIGVSVVNFNPAYIEKLFQTQEDMVAVFFDQRHIVADNSINSDEIIGQMLEHDYGDTVENELGTFKLISNELALKDNYKSIQIKTLVSLSSLYEKANSFLGYMYSGIIISTLLSVLMVYLFSRSFANRVGRFRDDIHNVALGNFKISTKLTGNDEISDLYQDLDMMVNSIERLIHENYEVELQKQELSNKQKDVQFKMLASQINPHFLYNALETIRMKALINKDKDIAEVVKKLAVIMRRNLSASNEEVTIADEVLLIRHYLDIQRFRFGDKVTYDLIVQDGMDEYMVLPLLMQPLVENAFVHGLEGKVGPGKIVIRIWSEGDFLKISVKDDGNGILPDKLVELKEKLQQGVSSIDGSIGLTNIYQRIAIYYGNNSGMTIDSIINEGTTVVLTLDLRKGEDHV